VTKQSDPICGRPNLCRKAGRLAHPRCQQARAKLRLERLAKCIVLRQCERCYELTEAQRFRKNRELSRCQEIDGEQTYLRTQQPAITPRNTRATLARKS